MERKKRTIGRVVKVSVFLLLLFLLFLFFTYLFRNTDYNARLNILDFYEEDTELDAVVIGASSIYRYWDPMGAWKEEGIATRNYSVSSMDAATYLPAIKDVCSRQKPKVIVVDARRFRELKGTDHVTVGARNMLDSMDYNISRLKSVYYYCKTMGISWDEAISLYIDLMQYHDNYDALKTKLNWQLADNRSGNNQIDRQTFKGYAISSKHTVFEDPSANITDRRSDKTGKFIDLYEELLDYCNKNEINLLIVATPVVITEEESEGLNTLCDIADSYGVPFLNMNLYYEEMGLDFEKDFYDPHHVNVLGADKVTKFFAKYLAETYDLTDHRGDSKYASWDELYEEYIVYADKAREEVMHKTEQ